MTGGEPTVRFEAVLRPDEAVRLMEAIHPMRQSMAEESGGDEAAPTLADALVRIAR